MKKALLSMLLMISTLPAAILAQGQPPTPGGSPLQAASQPTPNQGLGERMLLGGVLFTPFIAGKNTFVMPDHGHLACQCCNTVFAKAGSSFDSILVGGGVFQPLGGHASLVLSGLYGLSHSADEPSSYGSPWVYGAGVSVGF